jgi:hypothetical protein
MSLGVSCWRCSRLINEKDLDEDAPKFAHKDCDALETDDRIKRHEIGLMKLYMKKHADVAIKFMLESNRNECRG